MPTPLPREILGTTKPALQICLRQCRFSQGT